MSRLTEVLDRWLYPDFADNWDDELFRRRVLERLRPEMALLDLGAGAGIVRQMDFRGCARRVCGIDPDERVLANEYLDEGRVGVGESIPYDDATFDMVIADNVLEHLPEPMRVFQEVARVLRPGGVFLAKTPNRLHYMPLIARITPLAFHRFVNRVRGRAGEDTFRTHYRANTPRRVGSLARGAGLDVELVELVEGRPEYLRILAPAYLLGWLYERLVSSVSLLAPFRVLLVCVMKKPGAEEARLGI